MKPHVKDMSWDFRIVNGSIVNGLSYMIFPAYAHVWEHGIDADKRNKVNSEPSQSHIYVVLGKVVYPF